MSRTTQLNNHDAYINTSYSPLILFDGDENPTYTSIISSTDSNYTSTSVTTIAQRAADIFSQPIEGLTIFVCLLGMIANGATIFAILKMRQKLTIHLKLVISLCLSDVMILFANLSLYVAFIFTDWNYCTRATVRLAGDIAILATLLNLFVMAIDHYGAIIQPLRYKQKMTNAKGYCAVLVVWFVSIFGGLTEVFSAIAKGGPTCIVISDGNYHIEIFIIGFIFFVLAAICLLYGRIYCRIKRAMPGRERASHHSNSGSVKALMTTALFVGSFILLWTPFASFSIFLYIDNFYSFQDIDKIFLISNILYLFLLLNACFDPIIYAVRLPTVKRGCIALFSPSSKRSTKRGDRQSTRIQLM